MKYREIEDFDKTNVELDLKSKNTEKIVNAILSTVLYSGDYDYSEELIFRFIEDKNYNIRGICLLSLGHLARVFGKIDKDKAMRYLKSGLKDKSEFVRGHADSAIDDIEVYIK